LSAQSRRTCGAAAAAAKFHWASRSGNGAWRERDKVEGTAVYGADNRKIGSVRRVMLDKISGKVANAVISFGGFLGMGEDYYPTPWANLKYDPNLGGYRVGVTEQQLKGAPKYSRSTDWDWSDRARDREIYDSTKRRSGIERSPRRLR
jgi:PRC-barrel domain